MLERQESVAYLGLSYQDLVVRLGPEAAANEYARFGRQAFRPGSVLDGVLARLRPDVVVATNSPRAERAAIEAARRAGLPAVCLVDLFATDEVAWIGRPGYADRVCVLNDAVAARIVAAGRHAREVSVTGNPAFDVLCSPAARQAGASLRHERGWDAAEVVLWASQPEPDEHPSVPGGRGDPTLPLRIRAALEDWAGAAAGRLLVVRPHPSEVVVREGAGLRVHDAAGVQSGHGLDLPALLNAVDAVVVMNSTVGLQAHLCGRPVVQVLGSIFDESVPLWRHGMALPCLEPAQLPRTIAAALATAGDALPSCGNGQPLATEKVARVILELAGDTNRCP